LSSSEQLAPEIREEKPATTNFSFFSTRISSHFLGNLSKSSDHAHSKELEKEGKKRLSMWEGSKQTNNLDDKQQRTTTSNRFH